MCCIGLLRQPSCYGLQRHDMHDMGSHISGKRTSYKCFTSHYTLGHQKYSPMFCWSFHPVLTPSLRSPEILAPQMDPQNMIEPALFGQTLAPFMWYPALQAYQASRLSYPG